MLTLQLAIVAFAALFSNSVQGDLVTVKLQKLDHESITTQYAGGIKIGNEDFLVVFDTSSCNVIVASPSCTEGCQCDTLKKYVNPETKVIGASQQVRFFDYGKATGEAIEVDVSVASLTSTNQGVVWADRVTDEWCVSKVDGVAGLGTPNCVNPFKINSLFANLVQGKNFEPSVFSIHHARIENGVRSGDLIFGGYDPTYVDGDFTYVPLVNDSSWKFQIDGVKIGDTTVQPDENVPNVGFVDSSKSIIIGPANQVYQIYDTIGCNVVRIGRRRYCQLPCDKSPLPDLAITIGGKDFNISSQHYVANNGDFCYVRVSPCDHSDFWMLGDVLLEIVYPVFDLENSEMGFAKIIQSS